jgi:hypothetical protein
MIDPWDADRAGEQLLRRAAVNHLVRLHERGELDADQIRLVAASLKKSPRTVWRWVAEQADGRKGRERFELTEDLRTRFAYHRGNVAALHRELAAEAKAAGAPVVSVDTLERAVNRRRRDCAPGSEPDAAAMYSCAGRPCTATPCGRVTTSRPRCASMSKARSASRG